MPYREIHKKKKTRNYSKAVLNRVDYILTSDKYNQAGRDKREADLVLKLNKLQRVTKVLF